METKNGKEISPILISAGIIVIIVVTLGVLGLVAFQQRPTEVAAANQAGVVAPPTRAPTATPRPSPTATPTATEVTLPTPIPPLVFDKTPASADSTNPITAANAVTTTTDTTVPAKTASTTAVTTTTAITETAPVTATTATTVTETTAVPAPAADSTTAVTATAALTQATNPAASAAVDLAAASAIVAKGTCGACHTIPGVDIAVGVLGPNLATIGTDAATRIEGYTAEAYLRESILNPNAFVAPQCPTGPCQPNLMLPNLADLLTPAEIDTMINYLLTLKGQ